MSCRSLLKGVSLSFLGIVLSCIVSGRAQGDIIRVGMVADLSGPTLGLGIALTGGYETYFKMVNSQGGVNGNKIELLIEDGKYNMPQEIGLYKKLRQNGVLTVVSNWSTGSQAALMKEYIKDKNVVMSATGVPFLFNPVNPYIFLTTPSYDIGYYCMVDYVHKRKPGATIAVVHPDNKYGQDAIFWLKKRAEEKKIKVVSVILNLEAVDATSQVAQLKSANVDYVLITLSGRSTKTFLEAAQRLGLETPIMANVNTTEQLLFELAGHLPIVKNLIGTSFFATPNENLPGIRKLEEISKKFGVPKSRMYDQWFAHGWVDAMIFVEGLKRCGKNVTAENLRAKIEGIRNFDTGGLTAPLSYSDKDHIGSNKVKFVKMNIAKGYWESISDWVSPE